jgi:hypothetical protein
MWGFAGDVTSMGEHPGALTVVHRTFDMKTRQLGETTVDYQKLDYIETELSKAWENAWPVITTQLTESLGKQGVVVPGENLHDIQIERSEKCQFQAWRAHEGMGIEYTMVGCALDAYCTQPVGPKAWDPRFHVTFDVVLTMMLAVPERVGPLRAVIAFVCVSRPRVEPANSMADVLNVVNKIKAFFGGADFIEVAEKAIGQKIADYTGFVNGALADANKTIGSLAQAAAADPGGRKPRASLGWTLGQAPGGITLTVTRNSMDLTGDGVIRGTIRWPKSWGQPSCTEEDGRGAPWQALSIRATAMILPGEAGDFGDRWTSVGTGNAYPDNSQGDLYEIPYDITGLPYGVRIRVIVRDGGGYLRWLPGSDPAAAAAGENGRVFRPVGWSGEITLKANSPLEEVQPEKSVLGAVLGDGTSEGDGGRSGVGARATELGGAGQAAVLLGRVKSGVGSQPTTEVGGGGQASPPVGLDRVEPAQRPRIIVKDPTGIRSIEGIDFEMDLAPVIK